MKKLNKFFSVLLTAALLSGMLVSTALPVSAKTQAWDNFKVPATGTGMVLETTFDNANAFAQSPVDGALYASVTDTAGPTYNLLKSTDGGRTWKSITTAAWTAAAVAIVPSATEANVVFLATASTLYKSMDGGVTFTTIVGVPVGDAITALDVAMFGGRYIAVIGTDGLGVMTAGVYFWDANDVFNNLNPVGTTTFGMPVLTLSMAPSFATDRTVVAAGVSGGTTVVRVNVNGGAWGAALADVTLGAAAAVPSAADIAFPTDFNVVTSPIYFVAVADADAADGGVYRVIGTTPLRIDATVTSNNIDVDGAFNSGTAKIMVGTSAGTVNKSTNSGFSFSAVTLRSFVANTAFVLFDKDFATNGVAYVLNVGATGAFNVSIDGATVFNQWSLINDTLTDIPELAIAANGDMFMISNSGSLWRYFGATWERVATGMDTATILKVSPNYATDKTVFYAVAGSAAAIQVSTNSANKFAAMTTAPGSFDGIANPVYSFLPLNNSTVVVGDNAGKIMVNTSAFFWTEAVIFAAGYTVTDIQAAANGDLFAVAVNATLVKAAKSTDGGATWTAVTGTAGITNSAAAAFIAPANDYATSSNFFIAAGTSLYRGTTAIATLTTAATGVVTAPGAGNADEGNGVVYAGDSGSATVERVLGKLGTADAGSLSTTNAPAQVDQLFVTVVADGNMIWATDGGKIYNYTDTLAKGVTGIATSNIVSTTSVFLGIVTTTNTATISWDAMTNATGYVWAVDTTKVAKQSDAAAAFKFGTTTTATTANLTGLAADTTYFVSVWATADSGTVGSFMGTSSFTTVVGTPTPAMNLAPAAGATNVPVKPTFDWADVPGAVSYEVWVDTKADFSTAVKATTPISAYA
ncbi:hypothetical protein ABFB09_07495, partial [Dehalogenimonas sp. THU2]|uniref:hypothetical protein n=1 Tax=Dehalogenimonas sp. THU2 TaxID=3151121 RepID=UPI00321858D9